MKIKDTVIVEQTLLLDSDQLNVLGPDLELRGCAVVSEADSVHLAFAGATIIGGVFDQRTPLEDFHFERAHFRSVRFKGSYFGCDFGDWDDVQKSSISDCDFSEANLHNCRFLNCDIAGIRTSRWPTFIFNNPSAARDFVRSNAWPRSIGSILDIYTDTDPQCVAMIGNAEVLAGDASLTADEIRSLLRDIPGVQILD